MKGPHTHRQGTLPFSTLKSARMTGTDMETMDAGSQALAVRYIQKPQDGHADTVAKLSFSPSYVTYNPVTIENVQAFFKTGEVCLCTRFSHMSCLTSISCPGH